MQTKPRHKTRPKNLDWKKRYADNWHQVRAQAKELTHNRCCLCFRKAKEVHHCRYRDRRGAIAGREVPGIDVFPLCASHHKQAHHPKNWVRDRRNPVLGHHNTEVFARKLKRGFWLWRMSEYWWLVVLMLMFWIF